MISKHALHPPPTRPDFSNSGRLQVCVTCRGIWEGAGKLCLLQSSILSTFVIVKTFQVNVYRSSYYLKLCCYLKPCCSAVSRDICICTNIALQAAVQVMRCRLQRNTGGAFRSWEVRFAVGRCVWRLGGAFRSAYLHSRPAHLTWVWSPLIEIYSFYAINLGPFPGPS